jgi:hypothetical protein
MFILVIHRDEILAQGPAETNLATSRHGDERRHRDKDGMLAGPSIFAFAPLDVSSFVSVSAFLVLNLSSASERSNRSSSRTPRSARKHKEKEHADDIIVSVVSWPTVHHFSFFPSTYFAHCTRPLTFSLLL